MNFFLGYHQAMTSKVARNLCLQWKIISIPTQNSLTTSSKSALGFHSLHFTSAIFQFEERKNAEDQIFQILFRIFSTGRFWCSSSLGYDSSTTPSVQGLRVDV